MDADEILLRLLASAPSDPRPPLRDERNTAATSEKSDDKKKKKKSSTELLTRTNAELTVKLSVLEVEINSLKQDQQHLLEALGKSEDAKDKLVRNLADLEDYVKSLTTMFSQLEEEKRKATSALATAQQDVKNQKASLEALHKKQLQAAKEAHKFNVSSLTQTMQQLHSGELDATVHRGRALIVSQLGNLFACATERLRLHGAHSLFEPNPCIFGNETHPLIRRFSLNGGNFRRMVVPRQRDSAAAAATAAATVDSFILSPQFEFGFHGCCADVAWNIMCEGFDPTKRSYQKFGPGEYFGEWSQRGYDIARHFKKGALLIVLIAKHGNISRPRNPHPCGPTNGMIIVENPSPNPNTSWKDNTPTFCLPFAVAFDVGIEPPLRSCNCNNNNNNTRRDNKNIYMHGMVATNQVLYQDNDNSWKPCDSTIATIIAQNFRIRNLRFRLRLSHNNQEYSFDLERMTQTNLGSSKVRRLKLM